VQLFASQAQANAVVQHRERDPRIVHVALAANVVPVKFAAESEGEPVVATRPLAGDDQDILFASCVHQPVAVQFLDPGLAACEAIGQERRIPGANKALEHDPVKELGSILEYVPDRSGPYQDARRQLDELELHQIGFALQVGAAIERDESVRFDIEIDARSILNVNESNPFILKPKGYWAGRSRSQGYLHFPFRPIESPASMVNAVKRHGNVTESVDDVAVEFECRRNTKHGSAHQTRGLRGTHRDRVYRAARRGLPGA